MNTDISIAEELLGDREFRCLQRLIYDEAGIAISATKRSMVQGRLIKRLKSLALGDYRTYLHRISRDEVERQLAIDLLTTNETYFFREPKHFEFLQERVLPEHRSERLFRIWSAACSSGEEPYSLAMLLADKFFDRQWHITASDISHQVLAKARDALYPMSRAERIPQNYLRRFCLRGTGEHEGSFLIARSLRSSIEFRPVNLNQPLPALESFHVIFLRNVLIYFNTDTKREVISRLVDQLAPGGYLIIGHSESLNGFAGDLRSIAPSIYRKPA